MKYHYDTKGVCSKSIDIEIEDGIIKDVEITGGCKGNIAGIMKLCKGRNAKEVIELLQGIPCGARSSSCPDQLSIALTQALNQAE